MQVYRFADEPGYTAELGAICPVPPGALSIDYLIGGPAHRGRGLGAALIAAAVARGFADHPDAHDVLPQDTRDHVVYRRRRATSG